MVAVVAPGSRVTLHYSLQLGDGTPVDSTRSGEPATFVIGTGELADLLEARLLGMKEGERRHIEFSAIETQALATGESAQRLPRTDFPPELGLAVGQVIGFTLPNGREIPGLVREVTESEVVMDFSHPLAGRDLIFDVEIVSVEPAASNDS
jgi:FKBP-type peptidyl-prolyl cis-trans isomerase SlpA